MTFILRLNKSTPFSNKCHKTSCSEMKVCLLYIKRCSLKSLKFLLQTVKKILCLIRTIKYNNFQKVSPRLSINLSRHFIKEPLFNCPILIGITHQFLMTLDKRSNYLFTADTNATECNKSPAIKFGLESFIVCDAHLGQTLMPINYTMHKRLIENKFIVSILLTNIKIDMMLYYVERDHI